MREHVNVACKLPNGLILEVLNTDGVPVRHTIHGNRPKLDKRGNERRGVITLTKDDTFGVTPIPADYWAAWAKQNANAPYVKAGMVYAMPDMDGVEGMARELADVRTGLEGLDPDRPAPGIEKADFTKD